MVSNAISVVPSFGQNYAPGYIGFTNSTGLISRGIAYFEQWDNLSEITVEHALIVIDEQTCVEALMGKGVCRDNLSNYFDDPHTQIFFRKPLNYIADIGTRISAAALPEVGKKYDDLLIAAFALRGSFFGRFIHGLFGNAPASNLNDFMHSNSKWICSELAAHCMDTQPEYKGKGILADPDFTIDPQELFQDQTIFTPWHKGPVPVTASGS